MVFGAMRPSTVIGLCTALERARWSVWDQHAALLPMNYVEAVQRAGGAGAAAAARPAAGRATPTSCSRWLDGLLLAGGADIDPACYGQRPHPETLDTVPERDAFEIALTRRRSSATCRCSGSAAACS